MLINNDGISQKWFSNTISSAQNAIMIKLLATLKRKVNTDTSRQNVWPIFLMNDLTEQKMDLTILFLSLSLSRFSR